MKREIVSLRRREVSSTQILDALAANRQISTVLHGLNDQEGLTTIARRIGPASPLKARFTSTSEEVGSISKTTSPKQERLSTPPSKEGSKASTSTTCDASAQTTYGSSLRPQDVSLSALRTRACHGPTDLSDHRLIRHLISIYWIWLHPTHNILDMLSFISGYETGVETYCTLYLLYVVCIAACDYLDAGWENVEGKSTDVEVLRGNLVEEARRLEAWTDPDARTTFQAVTIMALVNGQRKDMVERQLVNRRMSGDRFLS